MAGPRTQRRRLLAQVGALGLAGGGALLGGCAQRAPHPAVVAPEPIDDNPLDTSSARQAATYRNIDRLAPTRGIRRAGAVAPLPRHPTDLAATAVPYAYREASYTLDDYLRRNRVAGLLILKHGQVALERYAMGNAPQSRWTTFSLAKSVTSTLIGAALMDGSIGSLDDSVARYVTTLRGTDYEASTIRHLLCMTSGIRWDEDYSILHGSDLLRFAQAIDERRSGAVMELMRTRPRIAAPGSVFNYSTGDSYILGAALAAATGSTLSEYLSRKVWSRLGMERDGYWLLDAPDGLETGGDNISATLRDYGRFGLFFLDHGRIGGASILPPGWRDEASRPSTAVAAYGQVDDDPLGFGYQWWSFPVGKGALPHHEGAFTSQGIFGQFLYINPREDVVAVVWSAWRSAWDDHAEMETYAVLGAAVALLADPPEPAASAPPAGRP
jgi:CubicO group peptidase (beta-lactamase class C family)